MGLPQNLAQSQFASLMVARHSLWALTQQVAPLLGPSASETLLRRSCPEQCLSLPSLSFPICDV